MIKEIIERQETPRPTATKIIFDWKRTLYDPDNGTLIEGTRELLDALKEKGVPLVLIGKGNDGMLQEVERLGISNYFSALIFLEGNKSADVFEPYVDKLSPTTTLVIGDRVRSELQIGNSLNATTIWVRQGKFADEEPLNNTQQPKHTISSLTELKPFLFSNFTFSTKA